MRTTGWLCILAASLLFLTALNTVYLSNFAAAMTLRTPTPQELPWQVEAGIEVLSSVAFLLPGLGLITPFGGHRRSHRSDS